ncbi:MAG: hypothetical protein ACFFCQ_17915 [Promethearchaeota archaeon]
MSIELTRENGTRISLQYTGEKLEWGGQHGQPLLFTDESGEKWILKPFGKAIDFEMATLNDSEISLERSPEENRNYQHFFRVANEIVASRVATHLSQNVPINVPEALVVTSKAVANLRIHSQHKIPLPGDVKILDPDDELETFEDFYSLSQRFDFQQKSDDEFDELLIQKTGVEDPNLALGCLIKFIPNSVNLDQFMDEHSKDDAWIQLIHEIEEGYFLIPFDVWLNDPDRNVGNYLVQKLEGEKKFSIFGIDYEMWAYGGDTIDEDDITRGRSYLAAIIHRKTNLNDPRILRSVFNIRYLTEEKIINLSRLPIPFVKFVEFHIKNGNLNEDEREKILQTDQNLKDFLWETKPRLSVLEEKLKDQIGYSNT